MAIKLSLFSYKLLAQVDEYIKEYNLCGERLRDAASDVFDGQIAVWEAEELRRKGLMKFVPDRSGHHPEPESILGYAACGSLELTKRAIKTFWPERAAPA